MVVTQDSLFVSETPEATCNFTLEDVGPPYQGWAAMVKVAVAGEENGAFKKPRCSSNPLAASQWVGC